MGWFMIVDEISSSQYAAKNQVLGPNSINQIQVCDIFNKVYLQFLHHFTVNKTKNTEWY